MRFLIVKLSSLGDVIQTLYFASLLHERFPEAKIDWVVEKPYASLLEAYPFIDRVFPADTRAWRRAPFDRKTRSEYRALRRSLREQKYSRLFDLQGNCKSALFTLMAKAKTKVGFGRESVSEWPNLLVTTRHINVDGAAHTQKQHFELFGKVFGDKRAFSPAPFCLKKETPEAQGIHRPLLMICPGSNWSNKQLSEEQWLAFLTYINEKLTPTFFIIWGSDRERELAEALRRAFPERSETYGQLNFVHWQSLICNCDGVISVDSSALHLSATTPTSSFSLFGPSHPDVYKPLGNNHGYFWGSCPYGVSFEKRCTKLRSCATGACMKEIDMDDLCKSFDTWWASKEQK